MHLADAFCFVLIRFFLFDLCVKNIYIIHLVFTFEMFSFYHDYLH